MSSWISWTSPFDEMVDKATSELSIAGSEDIALNLEICDQIRSKAVQPRDAMRSIKRRLNHLNPNVQLQSLSLLDTCVKNGGDHFLVEVASREFVDNLVSLVKLPAANREVRDKMLKLIQSWAVVFEGRPTLSYVGDVYKTLQREGFVFPPKDQVVTSSVMVDTSTAPEWIDSDVCLRCRTPFSFTNRKHHCRNCGQVFDQACSSKTLPLPHFGIAEPVRVCDSCFVKLKKKSERRISTDSKVRRTQSHSTPRPPKPKTPRELADEELQRAIELSLQESKQVNGRPGYAPATSLSWPGASEPPEIEQGSRPRAAADDEEDDPELRAAIEASLREAQAPKPSAPVVADGTDVQLDPGNDLQPLESDAILTFSQTVQEASTRGTRDLVRYPGFGELFERADGLRPKLTTNLEETIGKEQQLGDMHEKLSEVVRLYDRILTEQVANPARRYGQYASQYTPSYQSQAGPAPPLQQYGLQPPQQNQWNHAPSQHQWALPSQAYSTMGSPASPQQHHYQQQQQQPYQYGYNQLTSPSATPIQFSATPLQYSTDPQLPPASFTPAPLQQQYAPPPPQVQPPVTHHVPSPPVVMSPPPQSAYQPSSPVQYYSSKLPQPTAAPSQPTYEPEPMSPPPPPAPSLQHAPPPPQRAQSYQAPPAQLPNFPSAPTVTPQPYSHTTPVFEQKEAMLISFD